MADLEAGSPKDGDMIARNPANHDDQWLVAADYFAANFEPAMLAAAPKAEPDWFSVDDLAQEIRRVDGKHDLGAGALAEALMPFIYSTQTKVPKGEQGPVAWRGRISETSSVWDYRNYDMTGEIWPIVEPLYTHPAPASDELLEALEGIEAEAGRYAAMYPHGSDGRNTFLIFADGIAQRIAKHKGPQS